MLDCFRVTGSAYARTKNEFAAGRKIAAGPHGEGTGLVESVVLPPFLFTSWPIIADEPTDVYQDDTFPRLDPVRLKHLYRPH